MIQSKRVIWEKLDAAQTAIELLNKVEPDDRGCWRWKGNRLPMGYGLVTFKKKRVYAHRLFYKIFKEAFDPKLFVCHTCDTPVCCNPEHLFLGTAQDNVSDMVAKKRHKMGVYPRNTVCVRGHMKEGSNLYISPKGKRNCRACSHDNGVKYRAAKNMLDDSKRKS